jgi:hypothetical protein
MNIKVESCYDGWHITLFDDDAPSYTTFSWEHNDVEEGVGGEKLFAEVLELLGHKVEVVEDY